MGKALFRSCMYGSLQDSMVSLIRRESGTLMMGDG